MAIEKMCYVFSIQVRVFFYRYSRCHACVAIQDYGNDLKIYGQLHGKITIKKTTRQTTYRNIKNKQHESQTQII